MKAAPRIPAPSVLTSHSYNRHGSCKVGLNRNFRLAILVLGAGLGWLSGPLSGPLEYVREVRARRPNLSLKCTGVVEVTWVVDLVEASDGTYSHPHLTMEHYGTIMEQSRI